MGNKRVIESALGHKIALEIFPELNALMIAREDCAISDQIMLDIRSAKILSAFLATAMVTQRSGRQPEELDDPMRTVMIFYEDPAPLVRITQSGKTLDIHSPSWEALRCEIELVLPRIDVNLQSLANKTRH